MGKFLFEGIGWKVLVLFNTINFPSFKKCKKHSGNMSRQ
jgi:hypothetical protein